MNQGSLDTIHCPQAATNSFHLLCTTSRRRHLTPAASPRPTAPPVYPALSYSSRSVFPPKKALALAKRHTSHSLNFFLAAASRLTPFLAYVTTVTSSPEDACLIGHTYINCRYPCQHNIRLYPHHCSTVGYSLWRPRPRVDPTNHAHAGQTPPMPSHQAAPHTVASDTDTTPLTALQPQQRPHNP